MDRLVDYMHRRCGAVVILAGSGRAGVMPEIEMAGAMFAGVPLLMLIYLVAGWMAAPAEMERRKEDEDRARRDRIWEEHNEATGLLTDAVERLQGQVSRLVKRLEKYERPLAAEGARAVVKDGKIVGVVLRLGNDGARANEVRE